VVKSLHVVKYVALIYVKLVLKFVWPMQHQLPAVVMDVVLIVSIMQLSARTSKNCCQAICHRLQKIYTVHS
jgi:hypothetical protein